MKAKKKRVRRAPAVHAGPAARRPLLSLAMMVKDEEDFLEDALRSAQAFVDEMVVVDTGSTDRTVEIARDMGARVSHFEWCDDFSRARNVTLRRSTGQWIIVLDADERFRGPHPEALWPHLKPGPEHPFEGLALNVVNTRLDGTPISSFFSTRVFPNDARLGYSGRVHNRFGSLDPAHPVISATRYLGLEVVHLGYDPGLYAARQKAARSLPLIERTVREEPHNLQYRFYLGREYLTLGRLEAALGVLRPTVEALLAAPQDGPLVETVTCLLKALRAAEADPREALAVLRRALDLRPDHPDLWCDLGLTLVGLGEAERAAGALEQALARAAGIVDSQLEAAHRRWQIHQHLGHLYWDLQRYPEAYRHFLAALPEKPPESDGWPVLLNSVCALAIELGDDARKGGLLDRLLAHPQAPLGMYLFEVQRVARTQGAEAARRLLADGRARCPRLAEDPEYAQVARSLGVTP